MTRTFGDGAVRLERDDGIARIVLSDPDRRNALSKPVANGVADAVEATDETTRCVVLEGEGPAFCAGGDIDAMRERYESDVPAKDAYRWIVEDTARAIERVATCKHPTIAKLHGPAFGAGANLAIACDLQLLSDAAAISFGFRQVGLAVDTGTSYLLPRLVGENVALELVYTGELVEGERAVELGLANHVYPDDEFEERAEALIAEIASGPTVGLRTSKRMFRYNADATLEQAIEHEAAAQAVPFDTADHAEGVEAFLRGRDPEFEGE